jgi:hypothetical protein
MRARLRLPALIVTADGPRNGKDSSSRIRNPIGERRLLSNPVPRMCVGYEGPCIAPRKRQLLHEHHRTRFTNAPPTGNDGPPYWQTAEPRNPLQTSRLPTKLLCCHAPIPQAINAVAGDTVRILPQLLALHRRRVPLAPAAGTENFQSDNVDVPAPRCLAVIPSCWSKEMIWWRGKPRVPQ